MFELKQTLSGHTDRVWTIAWNNSGTILASSGGDKNIRLWIKNNDEWVCSSILTETHSKSIRRLCWSPCDQYLVSASFDSTISIWKRNSFDASWSNLVNLEGHETEVKSIAWSSDSRFLASCGRDKTIWIWEKGQAPSPDEDENDPCTNWDCSDVKNDHTKDVKHIVWHPKHNILTSCSYDDTVKFFHQQGTDWICYQTLQSHASTVWSADYSKTGEYLATSSDDRSVRIWRNLAHAKLPMVEPNSWKCISVIQGYHNRTIYDVSWNPTSDLILSASGDNSIALYGRSDEIAGDELFICLDKHSDAHTSDINCISWNPTNARMFATGSDDRSIKIWIHNEDDQKAKALTLEEEIMKPLTDSPCESECPAAGTGSSPHYNVTISSHHQLVETIGSLQTLQSVLSPGFDEKRHIEERLCIEIRHDNINPIKITQLVIDDESKFAKSFDLNLIDEAGQLRYILHIHVDNSQLELSLPRRSVELTLVDGTLFLVEKTGDLFKILPSGKSIFLLGHLFTLSDLTFLKGSDGKGIYYIVSADRDEKIRISNYPNTFEIERFCFGHKSMVRRILGVDDKRFVSIDDKGALNLWDITEQLPAKSIAA